MRITPASHIEDMSGANGRLVFSALSTGYTVAGVRKKAKKLKRTSNKSKDIVAIRQYMEVASQNWKMLSVEQREAWLEYAKVHFTKDETGRKVRPSGIATYVRANSIRQLLGLPLTTDAPTQEPPRSLLEIQQLGAQNPDSLGITIVHTIPSLANLAVLVRMTKQMVSVAREPQFSDFRFVRGVTPLSAQPLTASGSDVVFNGTRVVNDGQRYGVEARVVRTTDGLVSDAVYGDFLKLV